MNRTSLCSTLPFPGPDTCCIPAQSSFCRVLTCIFGRPVTGRQGVFLITTGFLVPEWMQDRANRTAMERVKGLYSRFGAMIGLPQDPLPRP
jgi:hypothetical protein